MQPQQHATFLQCSMAPFGFRSSRRSLPRTQPTPQSHVLVPGQHHRVRPLLWRSISVAVCWGRFGLAAGNLLLRSTLTKRVSIKFCEVVAAVTAAAGADASMAKQAAVQVTPEAESTVVCGLTKHLIIQPSAATPCKPCVEQVVAVECTSPVVYPAPTEFDSPTTEAADDARVTDASEAPFALLVLHGSVGP